MAISLDAYKNGLTPQDSELLSVLERTPYKAYELADLLPGTTHAWDNTTNAPALNAQLNNLISKGLVQSKVISGKVFYISSKAK